MNKVMLIGNVGTKPELRYTPGGKAVCNFSVATNEVKKNKEGERTEHTEWHRIVAWGKLAEICGEHLTKGRQIFLEGKNRTRTFKDREGHPKSLTEVHADIVTMLGKNPKEQRGPEEAPAPDLGDAPEHDDNDAPTDDNE